MFSRLPAPPPASSNPTPGRSSRTKCGCKCPRLEVKIPSGAWVLKPFPEPSAPGLGGPSAAGLCDSPSPCPRGTPPPPSHPRSCGFQRGERPSLSSSTPFRGPPSLSLPLPLAAKPGTARHPRALRRADFPTQLRGPSRYACSTRRPSGLDTGEAAPAPGRLSPLLWQVPCLGRTEQSGETAECPAQDFPIQSRSWDLARIQNGGERAGGKGASGHPELAPRLLCRRPLGARARGCCCRPARPPAVGREGSYARRRCADLLGKIPGFRPANRPRVTL